MTDELGCRSLSARELEIALLLVKDLQSLEISRHLGISTRTVEFHRQNISRKMGGIAGMTRWLIRHGHIQA